jgi:type IV secretory pathway TrbF-like protein
MSRPFVYILLGALVICVVVAGYLYYQESQSGIDIEIDGNGVSID